MYRFARPIFVLAALLPVLAATPAAADDGRRHVMTPTQQIDLVRDLPNDATFERDGQYFDLGYIYPIHTVNGASVASAGGDAGFVLYHDDRYARLDSSDLRMVTLALGEDPTEGYNPPVPVSSASAVGAASDAWSAPARLDVASATSSPTSRRSGSAKLGWAGFIMIMAAAFALHWARYKMRRAVRREMQGGWESHRPAPGSDPFEERVAARLAELHNGSGAAGPATYQPPGTAGFGRKGA